jgi:hypothetical protein
MEIMRQMSTESQSELDFRRQMFNGNFCEANPFCPLITFWRALGIRRRNESLANEERDVSFVKSHYLT